MEVAATIQVIDPTKIPATLFHTLSSSNAPLPNRLHASVSHLVRGLAYDLDSAPAEQAHSLFSGIGLAPSPPSTPQAAAVATTSAAAAVSTQEQEPMEDGEVQMHDEHSSTPKTPAVTIHIGIQFLILNLKYAFYNALQMAYSRYKIRNCIPI